MAGYPELRIVGITGMPEVRAGDDLSALILEAADRQGTPIEDGDVLVVAQKVVSKAEGILISLDQITPSALAQTIADRWDKDARHVEVVLQESRRIVRMDHGVLITETHHGFICANAGVDASNVSGDDTVSPLPRDSDASARAIIHGIEERSGRTVAVIVADTFGRPWREGATNVAIGLAGINPLKDYRGMPDLYGREMRVSISAIADELAGATELVMDKTAAVPVAFVRGLSYEAGPASIADLIRDSSTDLFR